MQTRRIKKDALLNAARITNPNFQIKLECQGRLNQTIPKILTHYNKVPLGTQCATNTVSAKSHQKFVGRNRTLCFFSTLRQVHLRSFSQARFPSQKHKSTKSIRSLRSSRLSKTQKDEPRLYFTFIIITHP